MPDAAQNTLGLFDSTALGWIVDTPRAEPEPLAATSGEPDAESVRHGTAPPVRGRNFYLEGDRGLARGWTARARDNLAAIRLSKELEESGRAPTAEEQARLLRFVGFGATDLAQNCFPLPGSSDFRPGWEPIGRISPRRSVRANMRRCNARPSMRTTRQSQSSAPCGAPRGIWALRPAACSSPGWVPGCSSPCCQRSCARPLD